MIKCLLCFLSCFLTVFSASKIEIDTIIVDRNTNIFINSSINQGVEFTTNTVPPKRSDLHSNDNRVKDTYEYCYL